MYQLLLQWHHYFWAGLLIYLPIVAIFYLWNWEKQNEYTLGHSLLARLTIGLVHAQMLIGILLMTHSPKVQWNQLNDVKFNFWTLVHPTIMTCAIISVTLSLLAVRRMSNDVQKHKWSFIFNLMGIILILVAMKMQP
jgi:hypothetical protein